MDYSSSAFRSLEASAPTTEIPIIYITTHGMYDVPTYDNGVEEDLESLDLNFEIPFDMTIIKFNFVPINVCNYGGTGTIGTNNVADYIHHLISEQLDPRKLNLDLIMSELNDCKVNDTVTSDSKLTEKERESVMRGNNVMSGNSMMMRIIDECVKKGGKDVKNEIDSELVNMKKKLFNLRKIYLNPELNGIPLDFESQKPIIARFNQNPEVEFLMKRISNAQAFINHVDDLETLGNWKISIPNKSGRPRYILDKIYSLEKENEPNGMDWNITMYKPKTGTLEDIFGLKEENRIPATLRKMTLGYILRHLYKNGMKTVILLDQTCSVFREITPENVRRDVAPIVERKWANTVKQLLDEGRTIYGGKRKKLKKTKNTKTKNTKTKNTKTKNTKTKNTKTKKNVNKSIYRKLIRKYKINK
jgi:hypothetical protein